MEQELRETEKQKTTTTRTKSSSTYSLTNAQTSCMGQPLDRPMIAEQTATTTSAADQDRAMTEQDRAMDAAIDDDGTSTVASTSQVQRQSEIGLVQLTPDMLMAHLQQIQELDDDDEGGIADSVIFRIKLPKDAMASEVSDIMRKFGATQVVIHTTRGNYEVYNETTETTKPMGLFDGYYFPPSFSDIMGEGSDNEGSQDIGEQDEAGDTNEGEAEPGFPLQHSPSEPDN